MLLLVPFSISTSLKPFLRFNFLSLNLLFSFKTQKDHGKKTDKICGDLHTPSSQAHGFYLTCIIVFHTFMTTKY
jgi:hypothetical protein